MVHKDGIVVAEFEHAHPFLASRASCSNPSSTEFAERQETSLKAIGEGACTAFRFVSHISQS